MTAKTIEIRDSATFIPALAVRLEPTNESDRYLLSRAGYGKTPERQRTYILLMGLSGGEDDVKCDPYDWGNNRSRFVAHQWLEHHFDEIESGAVVDVEFILKETTEPKKSEQISRL